VFEKNKTKQNKTKQNKTKQNKTMKSIIFIFLLTQWQELCLSIKKKRVSKKSIIFIKTHQSPLCQ
jgi:hypothetical protein